MFDIGFWELAIIGVVALIVIGPDKLPAVARTMGYWFGKARRFVATVQDDINREVSKTEELKRLLEEQSKIKEMHEIIEQTVDETKKSVSVGAQLKSPQAADNQQDNNIDNKQSDQAKITAESSVNVSQETRTTSPAEQVNEQAK
ncbi:Sec-independent protein translocase protein TatB [Kaarinaea lacus]